MGMGTGGHTLALDQNFPTPVLLAVADFIVDVQLVPLSRIRQGLEDLDDRTLLLVLDQLGFDGLVTNNFKMMRNPRELAALLKTTLTMFVIEGTGHDPLRATGAVLLDLPGALQKLDPNRSQVFWMRPRDPAPRKPWDLFRDASAKRHVEPSELYDAVKVTDDELSSDNMTRWLE